MCRDVAARRSMSRRDAGQQASQPANSASQHEPTRNRVLLAHKREIKKLAAQSRERGRSIVPLKVYFVDGRIKMLIGLGTGKRQYDKRHAMKARDAQRDMDTAKARSRRG